MTLLLMKSMKDTRSNLGFPLEILNGFALSTTTVDANIKKERINTTEVGIDLGFPE